MFMMLTHHCKKNSLKILGSIIFFWSFFLATVFNSNTVILISVFLFEIVLLHVICLSGIFFNLGTLFSKLLYWIS